MTTRQPLLLNPSDPPPASDDLDMDGQDRSSRSEMIQDASNSTADGTSFTERSVGFLKKLSLALLGKLPGSADRFTRIGFLLSVLQFLVGAALIISILVHHSHIEAWINDYYWKTGQYDTDATIDQLYLVSSYALALKVYHILFLGTQAFQFYLYLDAIVYSNTVSLVALLFFLAISFLYAIVNVVQEAHLVDELAIVFPEFVLGDRYNPHRHLGYAILGSNGVFVLAWLFIGSVVYRKMGWLMFRQIGADRQKRERYILHHLFQVLLKLDAFFFFGFALQYFILVVENPKYSLGSTAVGLYGLLGFGGTAFLVVVGHLAVRRQWAVGMGVFLAGCMLALAYLCSVMYDLYGRNDLIKAQFTGSREGLAVFVCGTMVFLAATIGFGIVNAFYYVVGPYYTYRELSRTQNEREVIKLAKEKSPANWELE